MSHQAPRSVPWMLVKVHQSEAGAADLLELACLVCQQEMTIPIDDANRWFGRATLDFTHATSCCVPVRLARASVARWN